MALSGGGYKAAVFHLGVLTRINEMGRLGAIHRFSSVSGGSIAAGVLASQWTNLAFDGGGVATNFKDLIFEPLIEFCRTASIDAAAGIAGVLSPQKTAADQVAKAYAEKLFGAKSLQDLPDGVNGPRFIFNATNAQLNSLVRMSQAYLADYRIGLLAKPDIPLAQAVAASSAFPPFLSPLVLQLPVAIPSALGADSNKAPFNKRLELTDGGVYDNLGIEAIWKRCRTLIVSNAGDPFVDKANPSNDWISQLRRTVSMIHRQAENNRLRTLMLLDQLKARDVAILNLRTKSVLGVPKLSDSEKAAVQAIEVRLSPLTAKEAKLLVQHGYSIANSVLGLHWSGSPPPSANWPVTSIS
ncbi:MAG: patatin-like phospholipase family protein [Hyphomonadaceae bacterium]